MANPTIIPPSSSRFPPNGHTSTNSRSPTRPRLMDDMLADLSPATTLEAFTSASGALKASIETASPTERAFGIRAAIASKKIQEWLIELSSWPWPAENSAGFELPIDKRRKVLNYDPDEKDMEIRQDFGVEHRHSDSNEYWGSLPAAVVREYESRIDEISDDMEDLNVDEIKGQVLNTHVSPGSRASSSSGAYEEALSSQSYMRMDDFTAVVIATVLQALPSLSRLIALMRVWRVRLSVLHEVSPLMESMKDVETALMSGWKVLQNPDTTVQLEEESPNIFAFSRQAYEIMRNVLQDKVSKLGQKIDYILDSLEGQDDTLPESWLDRMESIEQDYGEWVVCGERKVREAEWGEERAAPRLEQLRRPPSHLVGSLPPDPKKENSILEPEDSLPANGNMFVSPKISSDMQTKAVPPFIDHASPERPAIQQTPNYCEPHQLERPQDSNMDSQVSKEVGQTDTNMSQSTEIPKLTKSGQRDAKFDESSLNSQSSPSRSMGNSVPHLVEALTNLSSVSDGTYEDIDLKDEIEKSVDLPHPSVENQSDIWTAHRKDIQPSYANSMCNTTSAVERQIFGDENLTRSHEENAISPDFSTSQHSAPALITGTVKVSDGEALDEPPLTPSTASQVPQFEYSLTNSMSREMSPDLLSSQGLKDSSDLTSSLQKPAEAAITDILGSPSIDVQFTPQSQEDEVSQIQQHKLYEVSLQPLEDRVVSDLPLPVQCSTLDHRPAHIDLPSSTALHGSETKVTDYLSPEVDSPDSTRGHTRGPSSASFISGYATSEPSPVIHEAEPTEYFRPVSPPVIARLPDLSNVATPTRLSFNNSPVSVKVPGTSPKWVSDALHSPGSSQLPPGLQTISSESPKEERSNKSDLADAFNGTIPRRRPASNESVVSVVRSAVSQGRTSQEDSVSSEVSTITERLNSVTSTPVRIESPPMEAVPRSWHSQFVSNYDGDSPSPERIRLPYETSNYSPASSPPPETPLSEHRLLQLRKTPSFDPDSFSPDSPATPAAPPAPSSLELSPTPAFSAPLKNSDDQLQQQISEILESIPARITLTSEPKTSGTSDIKLPKKRISLNPFSRPASRAATPSFTLAPAYAKNPRPRPQNGNPEIKLYHLSRSTGEAPIKLFVRLVGEQGERVMVRVGGGWADLGEYLKEYASHHGRRSEQSGNVEIQDLPPRVVSTGSTASISTLKKGTWNTSEASSPISGPGSRPGSALGRPLSSLAIRKTRKSIGEDAREKTYRSPSTPLPPNFRSSPTVTRQNETPPSTKSARSVSQMSWREEESSLGLAGPHSRKGEISAENAAWVESMKEKVRIASAEKEKKEKAAFGNMGQVGATKRLFKKN